MDTSYFNTTNVVGINLTREIKNAKNQEEAILKMFHHEAAMSPSDVWKVFWKSGSNVPLTSVRRAMTVLTSKGKLRKTDDMKMGSFGKKEHIWKLL